MGLIGPDYLLNQAQLNPSAAATHTATSNTNVNLTAPEYNHGSEFIPRTPIDDNTTFMLLNAKYGKITENKYLSAHNAEDEDGINSAYKTYGERNHPFKNTTAYDTPVTTTSLDNSTTETTTNTTKTSSLSPPEGEMESPISAPPYQYNTKFVYEIPASLNTKPDNPETQNTETLLEQIRRVKFNNNQPVSAPVERTHYHPYMASFQYGIKNVNGGMNNGKVEDSMYKVQPNALFPPQLSKIACSSFNEFSKAICRYLNDHHINFTESVNYEGEESDVYHSYTSLNQENEDSSDPMEVSLQNRTVRTLIIDCYLKLEDDDNNNGEDMFIPNSLLESNSTNEAMEFLIEELSKQDRLADGIHFQMTIENISVGNVSNNSTGATSHPRTLYVRTLLDPTGVGPKEEKKFNDFIKDMVLSLK